MKNHQRRNWLRRYTDAPIWFAENGSIVFTKGRLRNKSPAGLCFLSRACLLMETELVIRMKAPETDLDDSPPSVRAIVKWQRDLSGQDDRRYQIGVQFLSRPPAI
ncbi:MAG: PilZ domain-containing protein [Desulfosarcina sp.]|nr:PilZ domain-containing protein [Desulfobacterales bacterium]